MPINLSIEYPKLQNEVMKLRSQNEELIKALNDARNTLLLCTLIDKSNTADKSFKLVESVLKKYKNGISKGT